MTNLFFILIIMGLLQAITEFLPVSSSGHLVLFQNLTFLNDIFNQLGENVKLFLSVYLHMATLVAVIIYLWKDIVTLTANFFKGMAVYFIKIFNKNISLPDNVKQEFNKGLYIIIASIPAGILGLLFKDILKTLFSKPNLVLVLLIINGFILIFTKKITIKNRQIEEMGILRSFMIGVFQALAMLPGISRSGMTIAGGLFNGMEPLAAAKFSFLMAIPAIAGAGLLEGIEAYNSSISTGLYLPLAVAMLITIIVAIICLKILFALVKRIKIDIFGYYTITLGVIGLIIYYLW